MKIILGMLMLMMTGCAVFPIVPPTYWSPPPDKTQPQILADKSDCRRAGADLPLVHQRVERFEACMLAKGYVPKTRGIELRL